MLLVLLEASLGGVRQELYLFLSDRWAPKALATFVGARAPVCGAFRDDVLRYDSSAPLQRMCKWEVKDQVEIA